MFWTGVGVAVGEEVVVDDFEEVVDVVDIEVVDALVDEVDVDCLVEDVDVTGTFKVLVVVLQVGLIFLELQAAEFDKVTVDVRPAVFEVLVQLHCVIVVTFVDVITAGMASAHWSNDSTKRSAIDGCIL